MTPRPEAAIRAALAAAALGAALAGAPTPGAAQLRAFEFRLDNDTFVTPRREDERWYTSGAFVRFAFDAPADAADAITRLEQLRAGEPVQQRLLGWR